MKAQNIIAILRSATVAIYIVLASFFCKFESILELSGSTIVFASVENVVKSETREPLVYFARKYFALEEIYLEPH